MYEGNQRIKRMKVARKLFVHPCNYYLAVLSESMGWILSWFSFLWVRRSRKLPKDWRRGLMIGSNHIGDLLYLTPSLFLLKRSYPQCQWDIIATPVSEEAVQNNTFFNKVISTPHERTWKGLFLNLYREISQRNYDVVICYDSSGALKDMLLAVLLRIPERIGFGDKGFSSLLTFPVGTPANSPQPYAGNFRHIVSKLTNHQADWSLRPLVMTGAVDQLHIVNRWTQMVHEKKTNAILCFVSSRQRRGTWPKEHFLKTIKAVVTQLNCQIIWAGGASEFESLDHLRRNLVYPSTVLHPTLDLASLVCFMKLCSAIVTTDSGPRHLGNAADVPVFFMRNIAVGKIATGAYLPNECDLAPDCEFVSLKNEEKIWNALDPHFIAKKILSKLQQDIT